MEKKTFIDALYKKRSTFNDPEQAEMLANLLDTVSSDIYSESQRFIFELIQNADDAALGCGNEIFFDFYDDVLLVSHKGKSFDEADINGIANAGKGTKGADTTKTGYKGIGFKSVFGKSNRVSIISDGYNFRFDRQHIKGKFDGDKMPWQIIPIWTELKDIPKKINIDKIIDSYNVSTIIEFENAKSLREELNELLSNGKILLFLRNITRVSISENGKLENSIEKKLNLGESHFTEVKLLKNNIELSNWIVSTFDEIPIDEEISSALKNEEKTPEKLKKAKVTEISFAAKIEGGKIKRLHGEESLIFTYLPTKIIDFGFPFLVNGSFLVNASREGIHEDRLWNQWLFKLIGEKILEWLKLLAKGKYKFQTLFLIPEKFNSSSNALKLSFNSSFEVHKKLKAFVPNRSLHLKIAQDILIDKTGLSEQEFIPTQVIIDYINRETKNKFSVDSFVHPRLEEKSRLAELGTYTFELVNLEVFFTDELFKQNHQPAQNFALIRYFYEKANSSNNNYLNEQLKSIPFIYAKGKKLKTPCTLCFPSISFETESGESVSLIHSEVYPKIEAEPNIKSWLEQLGVKEPSDSAYIENEIIGNIEICITETNYKSITRYLFNQHKKGFITELQFKRLADLKLFTVNKELVKAKECYLSDFYEPALKLESIYNDGRFVSHKYKEDGDLLSEWKTFFVKIGVSESVSWGQKSYTRYELMSKYPSYFAIIPSGVPNHMFGIKNDFYRYDMNLISFIELADQYTFSKIFWEEIFKNNIPYHTNKSDMGICYYPSSLTPFNNWIVQNLSIYPTKLKKCLKVSEVFLNSKENIEIAGSYLPVFDCKIFPTDSWLEHLPFKKTFEIEDYLLIIEEVAIDAEKDKEIGNANKKRLGLVFNKLASQIPNISNKKRNIISEWSKSHKLLSTKETFQKAADLIWVRIEGFDNLTDQVKFLYIPENCDPTDENFTELIDLFGVQIIDSFIPDIKNKEPNATLKIQLQLILPYLVAILERKHFIDYSKEFSRLYSVIDQAEFFNASDIVLSFKNQEEIIIGPSLYAYLDNTELSFKGKWTSPITLYALIPELLRLLNLIGIYDELMLLIQLDENEIKQWLVGQGYELVEIEQKPEYTTALEKVKSYTSEEDIEQSYDLVDNSDERSRISISQEAKENVFETLKRKGFDVPSTVDINYTIVRGIKNPLGLPIKIVVKSGKKGEIYFNPSEWLALTEPDTQLFVVTRGNIVRNVTLQDLTAINDTFHMRFNTHAFAVGTNLKAFANFFRYLPYTHFIFRTPESTTDYLEEFGLNKRNPSASTLSSDDKNLLR